jgi:hypothetical protein
VGIIELGGVPVPEMRAITVSKNMQVRRYIILVLGSMAIPVTWTIWMMLGLQKALTLIKSQPELHIGLLHDVQRDYTVMGFGMLLMMVPCCFFVIRESIRLFKFSEGGSWEQENYLGKPVR